MAERWQDGHVPRLLLGVSRRLRPRWALDMTAPSQNVHYTNVVVPGQGARLKKAQDNGGKATW